MKSPPKRPIAFGPLRRLPLGQPTELGVDRLGDSNGCHHSAWIMLISCGLWAGGILIFAVERTNLWRRMPLDQYAIDFRRSLFRVDPMMPILGVMAGIATGVFAAGSLGSARLLAWAAVAFIAIVVLGSIAIAEPINSRFRRLPEGQI